MERPTRGDPPPLTGAGRRRGRPSPSRWVDRLTVLAVGHAGDVGTAQELLFARERGVSVRGTRWIQRPFCPASALPGVAFMTALRRASLPIAWHAWSRTRSRRADSMRGRAHLATSRYSDPELSPLRSPVDAQGMREVLGRQHEQPHLRELAAAPAVTMDAVSLLSSTCPTPRARPRRHVRAFAAPGHACCWRALNAGGRQERSFSLLAQRVSFSESRAACALPPP